MSSPESDHAIVDVEVVVTCACGQCCHAETESYAIEEWRAHADDSPEADDSDIEIVYRMDGRVIARRIMEPKFRQ